MTSDGSSTPYDGDGRVEIPGCPGWNYLPIETAAEGGSITVTAEGPDGVTVKFSVPKYVSRGDELGDIARLVIHARLRMERSAGLGA
jgi:hypothetical protein